MRQDLNKWGIEWYSQNNLDGVSRHLIFNNYVPVIFHTRKDARRYVNEIYGYIKTRPDLRKEPHGWRMPRVVRLNAIEYET